ncbi:MAG: hypothetical protein ABW032_10520 [Burkholderiaceae bacterium]
MAGDYSLALLENFAMAARHRTAAESQGRCLDATARLGAEADRLGLAGAVEFVRWRVLDDLHFLEHWALAVVGDGRVIDLTAVQVDGDDRPLKRLEEYPANYVQPRRYPIAVMLGFLKRCGLDSGRGFSRRSLLTLHWNLCRHDAGQAVRAGSPFRFLDADAAFLRCCSTLALGYALERAVDRLGRVLLRMNE